MTLLKKAVVKMNSILKFTSGVLLVSLFSCNSYDRLLEQNENPVLNSKEIVKSLNLNSKFNINKELYNEFIESLTFENGEFVGAIYTGIEKELDDKSSDEFWGNFDISVRNKDDFKNKKNNSHIESPVIFKGYKPKRGGCVSNNRWICVIRDYAIEDIDIPISE